MAKHWMRGLLPKRILLWFLFLFSILFSFASLSSLAIVAPFASTGIGPVVNQLNQDTSLYHGVVFCTFSWPYMVKWHNSGIINFNIASFFGVFSKLWGYFWSFGQTPFGCLRVSLPHKSEFWKKKIPTYYSLCTQH